MMHWQDIALLILLCLGTIKGLLDGTVKQVISMIGWVLALIGTYLLLPYTVGYISTLTNIPHLNIITTIVLFIILTILVGYLGKIITKTIDLTPLGILNHLIGGFLGLAISAISLSFCLLAYRSIADVLELPLPPTDLQIYPIIESLCEHLWQLICST